MRLPLLATAALLFALPAFAQTQEPEKQDWQGMAASLQQQLMEAMSARMTHDTQMLRQLQAASTRAAAAEAKVSELEKKGNQAIPVPVGPQK